MILPDLTPETAGALETLGFAGRPVDAAVVLGSGLDGGADAVSCEIEADYAAIPELGACSVAGHRGVLKLGRFGPLSVLVFRGRRHYYESGSFREAAAPARIAAHLGAKVLILLSAVGGALSVLGVGSWVFVEDHVNLMGSNPLLGVKGMDGPPFVDLTKVYRTDLFGPVAEALAPSIEPRTAVLAAFSGPTYETPAEVEFARRVGAGVVGMSIVPEAVFAKALSMDVVAWGRVANPAAGLSETPLSHAEVLKESRKGSSEAASLVSATLTAWAKAQQ